jgi:hypothetical protein
MIDKLVIFSFIVGALSGLVVPAAVAWARDLGLKMNVWKWLLAALWYLLLNFFIFLDFTFIGEGEGSAGLKLLLFQGVIMTILAVGLVRLLQSGRPKKE